MVRMLTGALVKLGTGMWSEEYVLQKLHKPQSDKTSFSAPAHGLFLKEVTLRSGKMGSTALIFIKTKKGQHS